MEKKFKFIDDLDFRIANEDYQKGLELLENKFYDEAFKIFDSLANIYTFSPAMVQCGEMLYRGFYTKFGFKRKNKDMAKKYYEMASELGNKNAKEMLELIEESKDVELKTINSKPLIVYETPVTSNETMAETPKKSISSPFINSKKVVISPAQKTPQKRRPFVGFINSRASSALNTETSLRKDYRTLTAATDEMNIKRSIKRAPSKGVNIGKSKSVLLGLCDTI